MAELEQLSANPSRAARGTVVEANMHPRLGPVATLLVAAGTLKTGDVFHAGAAYGKVALSLSGLQAKGEELNQQVPMLVCAACKSGAVNLVELHAMRIRKPSQVAAPFNLSTVSYKLV